jgi:hypothetical protein
MKYTITFNSSDEKKFNEVMSRLDPGEFTVIEEVSTVELPATAYHRDTERQIVIDMEPESALTFRLGMKAVKIRRERTEEELAEEKALDEANTVKITVIVPPSIMPPTTP